MILDDSGTFKNVLDFCILEAPGIFNNTIEVCDN